MKILKKENGYTGVDASIAIVVIFIFVSIIANLIYASNSRAKEIEYKSKATEIAVSAIEEVKANGFKAYDNVNSSSETDTMGNTLGKSVETDQKGFYKTVTVTDYTDIPKNSDKISNLVKKVTVKIEYMFKGKTQSVELSTIISKEN